MLFLFLKIILDAVIPRYYYVTKADLERERREPGSAPRTASSAHEGLFLWNQAMFILAELLTANLLHMNELDPIRRYLPSYNRPRKAGRYSAFQVGTCLDKFSDLIILFIYRWPNVKTSYAQIS